ncbi:MAG: glycosyltransferase [Acidimicrobiia bacterium]
MTGRRALDEVVVDALAPQVLAPVIGEERVAVIETAAHAARAALHGRRIFNVNSTASGGGVAEMLQTLVAYGRGAGLDVRWLVIQGDPAFFAITKRIHNRLYGTAGDGGPLDSEERVVYERTLREHEDALRALVKPGDVVLVHDPQPAGLIPALSAAGAVVIWRCHVGIDVHNEWSEGAWRFLRAYVDAAHACVFTRRMFAPSWMADERVHVIAPSIDPFSTKNRELSPDEVHTILSHAGIIAGTPTTTVTFSRRDGSTGTITRHADVLQTGPPPPPELPLVVQVSRWDHMKDMVGVMEGFVRHVDGTAGAHLMLVGPSVTGVTDDPEGAAVLDECIQRRHLLPHEARARVHLACLPMHDPDENATIVNALQRHATVVVQKSLAEGFGLTVVEAMWKARPVVASRVGGIADQIADGEHGLLIDDPLDLAAFGGAVRSILESPTLAARLGAAARERARNEFLGDRHLEKWGELFVRCVADA